MPDAFRCHWLVLAVLLVLLSAAAVAAPFTAGTLRGVQRVQIEIEGVPRDFARYGLTAAEMREKAEQKLRAYGLDVVDADTALSDKSAGQINIRLYANQDTYANYSYRVGVVLKRKLALDASGDAFISKEVWSNGRNGLLNPSDLPRVYGDVDALMDQFISEHGKDNSGTHAAPDGT